MNIRNYGEIVFCKNIIFEDNKYDFKQGHPGVVLLPTTEMEEDVICLYMTSDRKRTEREKDKYIKYEGKAVKDSYINLQHIIKTINNKSAELSELEDEKFIKLLERFYNYQMCIKPIRADFFAIKSKIEVLLELLKINKKLAITDKIDAQLLNDLSEIKDMKRIKIIYGAKVLLSKYKDINKVEKECCTQERERLYLKRILELYSNIKNIKLDDMDLSDPNNPLRTIYLDFKNKYYLINVETLFIDAQPLFDRETKEKIHKFITNERETQIKKILLREEKRTIKIQNKKEERILKSNYKAKKKIEMQQRKYGDWEFFE